MKLNVGERLTLLQMLPTVKSNIVTWGMINAVIDRLPLSEKEYKVCGIQQEGGQVMWNENGSKEVEIEIGEVVSGIIKEELEVLENAKPKPQIEKKHVSLYHKFVDNKKKE